ncbi:hypothetical protein BFJ72_g133 [Fusarium proliferatum]|uniref:Uncharacterized protein n=1 Tax=Gibberella intermedia TaxID=948311 RepID=A0A420UA50_GIBIN|nr:hypothetical protein BFJ72_g133 [Fusarium proliferatum]
MRTTASLPKIPESGEDQFYEAQSIYEKLSLRLSNRAYLRIRDDLDILYNRQQRGSLISRHNDGHQFEITSCGFSRLHDLTAYRNSENERTIPVIEEMLSRTGHLAETRLAFGEITDELHKYVRSQDILGWTPLHYAAAWKNYEAPYWINSLLAKGADLDATDIRGWTPLHYSIWNRNPCAVRKLLEQGANTKIAGVDGITPLHCAAAKMTARVVKELISHPRQRADQFATDNFGRIPIHLAAQEGNTHVIATLRLSINEKDWQGRIAFHLAAFSGHMETISKIVECETNLNETFEPFQFSQSYTALHWAAQQSKRELVAVLLNSGANVNARCRVQMTPLHYACRENSLEIVDILINSGADVNVEDQYHCTPLRDAASCGRLEYVFRLLKVVDIDINARPGTRRHGSPLKSAIERGHGDVVRALVESGARISEDILDFIAGSDKSTNRNGAEESEEDGDDDGDEQETVDDNGEAESEGNKKPGLKIEDIEMYIRAAFSLRKAFEEHVPGEMGGIILSELIRRLCPP